jgi:hypothetical protein
MSNKPRTVRVHPQNKRAKHPVEWDVTDIANLIRSAAQQKTRK